LGAPLEFVKGQKADEGVLVMAGMHGDESITTVILSEALRFIRPEDLVNPVILGVNPDGLSRGTRGNARGVDLNRNYPAANWSPEAVCYRTQSSEPQDIELSPGTSPASEPETQALIRLIDTLKPSAVVSLHSALGCIDDPEAGKLSQWIAAETGLPQVPDVGYATPGSFGSWAKERDLPIITWEVPAEGIHEIRKTHIPVLVQLLTGHRRG